MKPIKWTSTLIVLAMMAFYGCSDSSPTSEKSPPAPKKITAREVTNKANPYDEQGIMYGKFLNALAKNKAIGGWDVSQIAMSVDSNGLDGWDVSQIIDLARDFNGSQGKDSGDKAYQNLSMQLEAFSGIQISDIEDTCWYHPSRCKDTKKAIQILDPSNGGTAHDRTIKYISAVRDLEAETMADDKLKKAEKTASLISYSIARHAAGYWYNKTRESKDPIGKITANIAQLSISGAFTAYRATENEEVGVGTAILTAYIASGKAK